MNRHQVIGGLALLLSSASSALAQFPQYNQVRPNNTYNRPPVLSPYLNLLPIRPPGVNYFLNVVPEMDRRQQFNQINSQLFDLERRQASATATDELIPSLDSTGHAVGFMNFAPYYNFFPTSPTAATNQYQRPPSRGSGSGSSRGGGR
jgi:hypothetical protein